MPDRAMPSETPAIASWYEIDAQDRLVAVCPEWDATLRQGGGGAGSLQGGVIGQPLLRFISGDASRMYMDAALQAARLTGHPRTLQYRCDTPTVRRRLEMVLQPRADGSVRIEHRLVEQHPRAHVLACFTEEGPSLPSSVPTRGPVWRCSVCLRLQRAGLPWQEPETVGSARLAVCYTVCPRCLGG